MATTCLGCGLPPAVRVHLGPDLYCRRCALVIAQHRREMIADAEARERQRQALNWPAAMRGDPIWQSPKKRKSTNAQEPLDFRHTRKRTRGVSRATPRPERYSDYREKPSDE